MNILLVHNFYGSGSPSGENAVFEAELQLLESRGHHVETFTRHNDQLRGKGKLGEIQGALSLTWNSTAARELKELVNRFKADVVHVHNTFPMISPAIFAAARTKAATVLTLHNYRLQCPAAIPARNGSVCTKCITQRSVMPALYHRCYRDSLLATSPLAGSIAFHNRRGTWGKDVDAFIALSKFQKNLMVRGGLPESKMHVKPNFFPGAPPLPSWDTRHEQVVFVGRLSREKGLMSLLRAWEILGDAAPHLVVVGDGPLMSEVKSYARRLGIEVKGHLGSEEVQNIIMNSQLALLPSEWFEGFPMVIREAFAAGTPVAASAIGPIPEIVLDGVSGVLFPPKNPEKLAEIVYSTFQNKEKLKRLGMAAYQSFRDLYNEDTNYEQLIGIYQSAIQARLANG